MRGVRPDEICSPCPTLFEQFALRCSVRCPSTLPAPMTYASIAGEFNRRDLDPGGMVARNLDAHEQMDSARREVTAGAEPLLRVSNITVRFGGIVALEDVS